jgi:hypothetical protein
MQNSRVVAENYPDGLPNLIDYSLEVSRELGVSSAQEHILATRSMHRNGERSEWKGCSGIKVQHNL